MFFGMTSSTRRRTGYAFGVVLIAALASFFIFGPLATRMIPLPVNRIIPMSQPNGMAPQAFRAYLHACHAAKINPRRVTQTIGDFPLSFGYHFRDGTLTQNGERMDYCAATDVHVIGLNEKQIERWTRELGRNGFAAWYRHGGKWKGGEHIHAVYAFVPMKSQLKRQVKLFLREEKPHWAKKWRRSRFD